MTVTIREPIPELSADQRSFRADVRALLTRPEVRDELTGLAARPPGDEPVLLETYRLLGERGWLAPSWPVEYGGLGLGAVEAAIVTEEMALAGVPDDVHVLGVDIVGLFLLMEGTEEQKREHLPALAAGERVATVLFTEPGCGSDLSGLATRAEPDGDGWRLYGSKVYNMKSQYGEIALCAARTSDGPVPMHGITLFLLPLRSPGVHVEPVPSMADECFCLVAIDGVRLGPESVVGRVDDGWRLMNDLLQLERTGVDFHGKARRLLDLVVERAARSGRLDDPVYAVRLAELDAKLRASHALAWEMVHDLDRGAADPVASAMSKWYASEQFRPVLDAGMEVGGADALLSRWDEEAGTTARHEADYRMGPAHRLASGTSEVMLYLIATNGLGML
ncbi:acyl-CoA dehydrogenase family protein [Nocardiopsis sp. FIRDI 009]|uniref:acyl-CoA dehydrogenase family protein n=1 Tax=Nocardiopsis sp. FIRDI 009 TaxID=714197 RepID=UPI000E258521|nr:acyl-CoA dehydrogenase family protein [Nocardiopsis sp. FIRDI 009]